VNQFQEEQKHLLMVDRKKSFAPWMGSMWQ